MTAFAAAVGAAALRLWFSAATAPAASPSPNLEPATGPRATSSLQNAQAAASAIEIAVVGSDADLSRVRALVRTKPGPGVHWRRLESFRPPEILDVAADGDARVAATRCWIDLSNQRRAHLYFVGRSGSRFLIRDVELSGKFDELDLTSLAEVIDLSLAAVQENDRVGISRAEAERLLVPKPAAPAAAVAPPAIVSDSLPVVVAPVVAPMEWGRGVRAGVFYAGEAFASELPLVSGPGLILSLPALVDDGAGARWELGVWLSGQYQIPAGANGELASVRLAAVATRAGVSGLWRAGDRRLSRWAVEVRLGAGADTIHLTPEPGTKETSAALTPARWSTSVALTGAVGVSAAFGSAGRLRLGARLFADLLPIATHYDVAIDGQPTTVVAPDRVRPGVIVDLTVALGRADGGL